MLERLGLSPPSLHASSNRTQSTNVRPRQTEINSVYRIRKPHRNSPAAVMHRLAKVFPFLGLNEPINCTLSPRTPQTSAQSTDVSTPAHDIPVRDRNLEQIVRQSMPDIEKLVIARLRDAGVETPKRKNTETLSHNTHEEKRRAQHIMRNLEYGSE
jgi:hypothetical protein